MKNNYRCLNSNRDGSSSSNVPGCYDTNKRILNKRRLCLKCGKKFLSIGPHNRLCEKCISTNEKIAMKAFYVSSKLSEELEH